MSRFPLNRLIALTALVLIGSSPGRSQAVPYTFTKIAQSEGTFADFNGFFCFTGSEFGIFTDPDPLADKVISSGDHLPSGFPVMCFGFSPQALKNWDQIAFFAGTADRTRGIYRANPVPACSSRRCLVPAWQDSPHGATGSEPDKPTGQDHISLARPPFRAPLPPPTLKPRRRLGSPLPPPG